jgi:2-oxoisovalerate dehydrogenase E2 component (dihydrolipoyl transacylase)
MTSPKVGSALVDIETGESSTEALAPKTSTPAAPLMTPGQSATAAAATPSNLPSKPFLLADIGEGIAEVELMAWYVKEGDVVKAFDKICEVQSDKATVEITSRYDGLVTAVHHGVGSIVKVAIP